MLLEFPNGALVQMNDILATEHIARGWAKRARLSLAVKAGTPAAGADADPNTTVIPTPW